MKKSLIMIAAALFIFAGCQKEASVKESTSNNVIHIGVKQLAPPTKVAADDISAQVVTFHWEDGDKVMFVSFAKMDADQEFSTTFECTNPSTNEFTKTSGPDLSSTDEYLIMYPPLSNEQFLAMMDATLVIQQTYRVDQLPKEHVIMAQDVTGISTSFTLDHHNDVLHFKLKGTQTIGKIEISTYHQSENKYLPSSALTCGESGVQLNQTTPTNFYIDFPLMGDADFQLDVYDTQNNIIFTKKSAEMNWGDGNIVDFPELDISEFPVPVNPYVEIAADYDHNPNTPNTTLKWYRQNLAISDSGKKAWKGNNTSGAVKVPGTDEDVIVGDYFQWAAYANYSPTSQSQDQGLLLYTSFDNKECGDTNDKFYTDGSDFSKSFILGNAPYGDTSNPYEDWYSKYNSGSINLEKVDDVASINLGGDWRMPTSAEFQVLYDVTYWAWDGTACGYYVFQPGQGTQGSAGSCGTINATTDDKSKALLFFPAAGSGNATELSEAGSIGRYWSSSLYSNDITYALCLYFHSNNVSTGNALSRYCGVSVRPVSE